MPLKDLLVVENTHYLKQDGQEEQGRAVALVDVDAVYIWENHEMKDACASFWQEGYFAWVLTNLRSFHKQINTVAKRKIYLVEIDHP